MYQYYSNQQVIRVNGENGARAYQMNPNSSAILLDESAPLIWFKQTDGAGYPTITPYKIEPYVPEPEPDIKSLLERIQKLEERFDEGKSNSASNANKSNESGKRNNEHG